MKKIQNNPKLYYIFAGSFIILAVLTIILGIFIISQLQEVAKINEKTREALSISQLALDFNVENFHTQLEVWEYAYEPNPERLVAFQEHEKRLIELSESLTEVVKRDRLLKQGAGLVPGGDKEITQIIEDLERVRTDWVGLFAKIKEVEELKDKGYNEAKNENHAEYMAAVVKTKERVISNELLFDELDFNREIDEFVKDQENFLDNISAEPEKIISRFTIFLTIFVTLLFILGVAVPLFFIFANSYGEKKK